MQNEDTSYDHDPDPDLDNGQKAIRLPNGGAFIPIPTEPFQDPRYKVDVHELPDLPAGISINDLIAAANTNGTASTPLSEADLIAITDEAWIRSVGYLPRFDAKGFDQYGYDVEGFDHDGLNRIGYARDEVTRNEREAEADFVSESLRRVETRSGREDRRYCRTQSSEGHRGNARSYGQMVYANDKSGRTLGQCWYKELRDNEERECIERLTDQEIANRIALLFPDRATVTLIDTIRYRNRYNRGGLACQEGKVPEKRSYRYVRDNTAQTVRQYDKKNKFVQEWNVPKFLEEKEIQAKTKSRKPPQKTPRNVV